MAAPKSTPKDAQVMAAILKDMGIIEYDPKVINQMLEFTYRYITNILDDARVFASHAKKKILDVDDVKLAIQMQMDKSFTTPPPRDILIEIARQRNSIPLPLIKPHSGPRLPPDRYCLTACNFKLKSTKKASTRQYQIGVPFGSISNQKINVQPIVTTVPKMQPAVNLPSKAGATLSLVTKGVTTPTVAIVTRPASVSSSGSTLSTPIIKITPGVGAGGSVTSIAKSSAASVLTASVKSTSTPTPIIVTRTVPASLTSVAGLPENSAKRKRDDDDDFDAV